MKLPKLKAIISVLLVGVMFTSITGCSKEKTSPKVPVATSKTATYTDMVGRKVKLTTDVKKIVIIRTMDIYTMAAILGTEMDQKLIGVGTSFKDTDIDGYKKLSEVYKNLDSMVKVGSIYDDAISLETVVKLQPDIIIADKQFQGYACLDKMIAAGLPVVFTDINTDPFHGIQKSMKMLGKMLGKEKKVNEMVDYSNAKTDDVLKKIDSLTASKVKKPKLYFECGNVSPTEMGSTGGNITSGWGYLWNRLGANSIGAASDSKAMNPEQVLVSNPDVIVIGGANWNPDGNIMRLGFYATKQSASQHLDLYTKRAGWTDLTAIKTGRLHSIHYNYFIRPYNFAGVESMAKFLYPKEFKDLNPEKDVAEFFDKYMPVKYSGIYSADWSK